LSFSFHINHSTHGQTLTATRENVADARTFITVLTYVICPLLTRAYARAAAASRR
jgi:hypothetical protein